MSKVVGNISKIIFKSDTDYMVFIFKVKENDIDSKYNSKSITATGYLHDVEEHFDLALTGEFQKHKKYGEQFIVTNYQMIVPEDKNSIVTFLSSELFKGIGEAKALKIHEKLGDDCINLIKENPEVLKGINGLTDRNIQVIYNKLIELDQNTDTLLNLTELGFSVYDATLISKKYKVETLDVVNRDIYTLFYDLEKLTFNKVDIIARKNGIEKNDIRRISAGIIYSMKLLSFEKGDTYSYNDEIFNILRIVINYEPTKEEFQKSLENLINNKKIYFLNEYFQLNEYYQADQNIVKRLTYLNNKEDLIYKSNYLDKKINEFEKCNNILYDEKQKEAIKNAFLKNILIITGGPGTGKTTIIKSIVSLYKDIFNLKNKDISEEVILLAPTGRASKRIMEATLFKASTIHRFLKWNKDTNRFQVNEYNKSDAKLVIIDEVSMLDTILFDALLSGLKYDTRIILVGDANQLPSVQAGEVLKDIIESDVFEVVKLERLYRQSDESKIIELAYDINEGDINYSLFNKDDNLMFYQANSDNLKDILEKIVYNYKNLDYHEFQIMAPMYKTLNGINNLNQKMQELFNPKSNNKKEIVIYDVVYREGDKVLQLMNMPDDNIYNGDIGIILEINTVTKEIVIDFDSNIVTFNSSNFMNFTLGYVISIHKSQGSEFKTIIIPILKEYGRMLYRKLIYTGVTRSKEKLILLGEKNAFDYAIINNKNDFRKTNLKEKIKNRYS